MNKKKSKSPRRLTLEKQSSTEVYLSKMKINLPTKKMSSNLKLGFFREEPKKEKVLVNLDSFDEEKEVERKKNAEQKRKALRSVKSIILGHHVTN